MDGFLTSQEQIYVNVTRPTDSIVMQVIWPADRRPAVVNFTANKESPRDVTSSVRRAPNGRRKIEWALGNPQVEDEYVISWEW